MVLKNNLLTVNYRAFCDLVAPSSEQLKDFQPEKSFDPAFKKYFKEEKVEFNEAFQKIALSNQKFRYDFKNFMIGRDKRKIGLLTVEEFI